MKHIIQPTQKEESFWMKQLAKYANEGSQSFVGSEQLIEKKFKLQQTFSATVVEQLNALLRMSQESQWPLATYQKAAIDAMTAYLLDNDDVIPDNVPGIGLLDDAMVIASVAHRLQHSLTAYLDYERFCQTYAHGQRYSVQDWQRNKAQEVRSVNRQRRLRRISTRTQIN